MDAAATSPTAPAPDLVATDDAIAEAQSAIEEAEAELSTSEQRSRSVVAIVVMAVWGVAVLGYGTWLLLNSPEFLCTVPGDPKVAGYTGTCENGWSAAIEQAKDLLSTAVLPVVTLVIGYLFGKRAAQDPD